MQKLWMAGLLWVGLHSGTAVLADQVEIEDYDSAKRLFWGSLYTDGVATIYCNVFVRKSTIEHVVPASWMKNVAGCSNVSRKSCRRTSTRFNYMEADLHNLYPALSEINLWRSNYRFTIIFGSAPTGSCDFEYNVKQRTAEPRPQVRGDLARANLYMSYEYGVDLNTEAGDLHFLDLMRYWHCSDPVDAHERWRNNAIAAIQGTRNPYIDRPSLVDCDRVGRYPND